MAELSDENKFELAVINPAFVLGPCLGAPDGTSATFPRRLLQREMPVLPRVGFASIDVRDVATAHVNAMTSPEAAGNRHILATGLYYFSEFSAMLGEEFRSQGYDPPTDEVPVPVDYEVQFDNSRMRQVLGIEPRPIRAAVMEMAYDLIERGFIKKTDKYRGPPKQ